MSGNLIFIINTLCPQTNASLFVNHGLVLVHIWSSWTLDSYWVSVTIVKEHDNNGFGSYQVLTTLLLRYRYSAGQGYAPPWWGLPSFLECWSICDTPRSKLNCFEVCSWHLVGMILLQFLLQDGHSSSVHEGRDSLKADYHLQFGYENLHVNQVEGHWHVL